MSLSSARFVLFGAVALIAVACNSGSSMPSSSEPNPLRTLSPTAAPTAVQEATIPLTPGNQTDPAPRILVAFPSASPFSMVLDTGSVGLRILPNAMMGIPASAYTDTQTPTADSFGGDRVFYGTIGVAHPGVTFGGAVAEQSTLKFMIVDKVCSGVPSPVPTGPPADCTDVTQQNENTLGGGFVGVRPSDAEPIYNPFAELPAPLNSGFVVSAYGATPSILVGATSTNQTGFQTFPVATEAALDGSPAWQNTGLLPFCYTVTAGGSQAPQGCPSPGILVDSGGLNERVTLPVAPPAGISPNVQETLPPGSTVVATLGSAGAPPVTWTLTTGSCHYYNAPQFYFSQPSAMPSPSGAPPPSNNGITPFLSNDVLYDLKNGAFGLRPVTAGPPAFC